MTAKYRSTKTYGHDLGLSACFRQWKATHSHCSKLHGYALSVHIEFESETLDERNWVMDFGSLKPVKEYLTTMFDHQLLVANDDPERDRFLELQDVGAAEVRVVPAVGCEAFARMIFEFVRQWVMMNGTAGVRVVQVEVREHGANSAIYMED